MAQIKLNISGMTCNGCVASVKRVLQELDGVQSADVFLDSNSADIHFDESQIGVAKLIEAIEDAGFDATI